MTIARTAMIDDDGTGTTGTVFNNAWKTALYNDIDADPAWITIGHNSASFTSVGNNWYVATAVRKYALKGKMASISIGIKNSHNYVLSYFLGVGGWPFTFKSDALVTGYDFFPAVTSHSAPSGFGLVLCNVHSSGTYLDFRRTNFSDWPVTGDDLFLGLNVTLEIV